MAQSAAKQSDQILVSNKQEESHFEEELKNNIDSMLVEEQVTLASLRPRKERKGIDSEPLNNAKLKNQYQAQSTENVYPYYCGLCGSLCLATNFKLENMPSRNTDGAICLNYQNYFLKHYLHQGEEKYIKRKQGAEHQWRFNCECGIQIAYISVPYDKFEQQLAENQEKLQKPSELSKKFLLYILNDSLVIATKHSMLFQEISKTKYII